MRIYCSGAMGEREWEARMAAESQGAQAEPRMVERTTERKASCGGNGCEWQGKELAPVPPP
jgi:hypothetical protein